MQVDVLQKIFESFTGPVLTLVLLLFVISKWAWPFLKGQIEEYKQIAKDAQKSREELSKEMVAAINRQNELQYQTALELRRLGEGTADAVSAIRLFHREMKLSQAAVLDQVRRERESRQ